MHKTLTAIALVAIFGSIGATSISYAQSTGGNGSGGGAMSSGAGKAGATGSGNAMSGNAMGAMKGPAATCPDGTPMPPGGVCPTAANAKATGGANANAQTGSTGTPAAAGTNGSAGAAASGSNASGSSNGTANDANSNGGASGTTNNNSQANASSSSKSSTTVDVTDEQKTTIRNDIKQINVAPVQVNFTVNVGVAVPHTVHFEPVPASIVTLVPAYQGFLFFMLPDGRIVIVDPATYEIVLIL